LGLGEIGPVVMLNVIVTVGKGVPMPNF
jgi:hypothetical protein